jgi:hypothetical protein
MEEAGIRPDACLVLHRENRLEFVLNAEKRAGATFDARPRGL